MGGQREGGVMKWQKEQGQPVQEAHTEIDELL